MSLLKHDSFGATPYLVKGRAVPTVGKGQVGTHALVLIVLAQRRLPAHFRQDLTHTPSLTHERTPTLLRPHPPTTQSAGVRRVALWL